MAGGHIVGRPGQQYEVNQFHFNHSMQLSSFSFSDYVLLGSMETFLLCVCNLD